MSDWRRNISSNIRILLYKAAAIVAAVTVSSVRQYVSNEIEERAVTWSRIIWKCNIGAIRFLDADREILNFTSVNDFVMPRLSHIYYVYTSCVLTKESLRQSRDSWENVKSIHRWDNLWQASRPVWRNSVTFALTIKLNTIVHWLAVQIRMRHFAITLAR
jgi:hypothetical protein